MLMAIQEEKLPGQTVQARLTHALELGLDGIEVSADNLTQRVPNIVDAMLKTGINIAAINLGRPAGYISPDPKEREAAINRLREALANAVDLEAPQVVFVPHYGPPQMPDLTPYRSPRELESEMMVWLLRTVSDLAHAMDVDLHMLPVNHNESYFMTRLDQAVDFRQKIKNHPHVKVAANVFHMAHEEADWLESLKRNMEHVGYIQLTEQNGGLPGQGTLDFKALRETSRVMRVG